MFERDNTPQWLVWARKIQAIAQSGLTYTENEYDVERYNELRNLAIEIVNHHLNHPLDQISDIMVSETGYLTPKIDVRGVIFRDNTILLVQERVDGKWALPGGWAETGHSPTENVVKEVLEEAGLVVEPVRLLMLLDKEKHNHPPSLHHTYKCFLLCRIVGGEMKPGFETLDVSFFSRDNLPPLSEGRTTGGQISMAFSFKDNPEQATIVD